MTSTNVIGVGLTDRRFATTVSVTINDRVCGCDPLWHDRYIWPRSRVAEFLPYAATDRTAPFTKAKENSNTCWVSSTRRTLFV